MDVLFGDIEAFQIVSPVMNKNAGRITAFRRLKSKRKRY
jgi:hypothetical protein